MEENKNIIPEGSNNAGNAITWLEKILILEKKYGIKSIVNGFLILFVAIVVGWVAFNPGALIENIERIQNTKHEQTIEQRKRVDPQIKSLLVDLRSEVEGERAFLFETHNGGSNINGLPFLYVDMTYDEPARDCVRVLDEYKNVSQSRYDFMSTVYQNSFWYGSIEDIKDFDMELYYRLQKAGVEQISLLVLYGGSVPSGVLGVTVNREKAPAYNDMRKIMHKYGSQVTMLITPKE